MIFGPSLQRLISSLSRPIIEEQCSKQNIAFMECKTKCEHPKECLSQAHAVQDCVMDT